jgi:hypothetical protein
MFYYKNLNDESKSREKIIDRIEDGNSRRPRK